MTDLLGYFGLTLLLAGLPMQVALWLRLSKHWLAGAFLFGISLVLIPWLGMPLVYFLRGVGGDLSIATTILVISLYYRLLVRDDRQPASWQQGLLLATLLGTLYACTLGYLPHDLYGWGYRPQVMLVGLFALMLWAWQQNRSLAVAWLAGAIAFATGLAPSKNLWDVLFDPYLFLGSLWTLSRYVCTAISRKRDQPVLVEQSPERQAA